MRYISILIALLLVGCNNLSNADNSCQQPDLNIEYDFDNARVNECQRVSDNQIVITITPENSPINNSPWYAFKASSLTEKTITVVINYRGGDHRYQPKLTLDGNNWQAIEHQADKDSVRFNLSLSSKPVTVAAQEIITNDDYRQWMQQLARHDSVSYTTLGLSTQQREIGQLEITGQGNEWLVILGRQHPPEVTGALALLPFVEYLLQDNSQTRAFRQRFNVLVIPDLNPDGVALGNWRHNANGVDLNRDWKEFKQIESRLVRDKLVSITQQGGKIVYGVDFHSTRHDVFYTMPGDYGLSPALLSQQWLGYLAQQAAPFVVIQKSGNNPDKGVFKQYIADTFGVHAVTYEMGDHTDRNIISDIAKQASETLIATLLATPAAAFEKTSLLSVDLLISASKVFVGDGSAGKALDIGICGELICAISERGQVDYQATRRITSDDLIVSPGFIDAHTHSLQELLSKNDNGNLNYLTQGVTTVVNGNDGSGPVDIKAMTQRLLNNGIGTNTALLVGHGSIRKQVLGLAERHAKTDEIKQMQALTEQAMRDGAIGLSSGLYYVPGIFADTAEVVALAKVAAKYNGIYDTHLRDESTFNIGFGEAVAEAIEIAKQADIHLHIAHIKALGVDVWGQSVPIIKQIEAAQQQGVSISADQYPWQASGTHLRSAVVPKWVMADSITAFHQRLNDPKLLPKIRIEIIENIRRRGGAEALLFTVSDDPALVGNTLEQVAKLRQKSVVETVIELVQGNKIRVASFNMSTTDIENFMIKSWVVTSSDGTDGHPRKYASFPKKYRQYVVEQKLLSLAQFITQSSAKTAQILKLKKRGLLVVGNYADIVMFDPDKFSDQATFSQWNRLSQGVEYVMVNGQITIDGGQYNNVLNGKVVR